MREKGEIVRVLSKRKKGEGEFLFKRNRSIANNIVEMQEVKYYCSGVIFFENAIE